MNRVSRTRRLALVAAALALGASATLGACGTQTSHVYVGRQYDPSFKCFGEDVSIDVVYGPQPGSCPPICIMSTFDEAGILEAYVSSMCGPFPNYPWVVVTEDAGTYPLCQAALLAWGYDTTCEDGGIIINVPDASEAGNGAGGADASDATTEPGANDAGAVDATAG
jgi:hypothetical protein